MSTNKDTDRDILAESDAGETKGGTDGESDYFTAPVDPSNWGIGENLFGESYAAELVGGATAGGIELTSSDTSADEVYAGASVRREMERISFHPDSYPVWLGYGESRKNLRVRQAGIDPSRWFQPVFFTGAPGTGKTTSMVNGMTQLAYAGYGFCFIDPHGDAINDVLARIPETRLDDVVYIAPPTGEFDRITALNLLEVDRFDGESQERYEARVSNVVDENIGVFAATEEMFARMERILKAVQQAMIEADEPYTPMSIHKLLEEQELQEGFVDRVSDTALQNALSRIVSLDQADIEPATGRMDKWVLNKVARRVISHSQSSVDISQAVEDGKIILVDTKSGETGEDVAKAIGGAISRRVWATVRSRTSGSASPKDRRPFFLVVDELEDALPQNAPIPKLTGNARKYRLGVWFATQAPTKLPSLDPGELGWDEAVLADTKTLVAGRLGDEDSAFKLANNFDDVKQETLQNLPDYKAVMTVTSSNGGADVPVIVNTFPPYPPLRDALGVREVKKRSLDTYGVDPNGGVEYESALIEQVVRGTGAITTGASEIQTDEFLTAIDAVELFEGATTAEEYVPLEAVSQELSNRFDGSSSTRQLEKAVVQLPETYVSTQSRDGSIDVSLTPEGRATTRDHATGDGSSAGGAKHQMLLQEARNLVTRLRCDVAIPDQDVYEGSPPDATAELPVPSEPAIGDLDIDITGETVTELTPAELDEVRAAMDEYRDTFMDRLSDQHDALPAVSAGRDMYIEVESATRFRPALTLRNLRKAVEDERRCVFVVRGADAKDTVVRSVHSPRLVSKHDPTTGDRTLYTGDRSLGIRGPDTDDEQTDFVALRRSDAPRSRWHDTLPTEEIEHDSEADGADSGREWGVASDHEFVLETTDGESILRVGPEDVRDSTVVRGSVPAWGGPHPDGEGYIAYEVTSDGTVRKRVYSTKAEFTSDWTVISRPLVPEIMFEREPTVDDWCVVILPDDSVNTGSDVPVVVNVTHDGDENVAEIRVAGWGMSSEASSTSEEAAEPGEDAAEAGEEAPEPGEDLADESTEEPHTEGSGEESDSSPNTGDDVIDFGSLSADPLGVDTTDDEQRTGVDESGDDPTPRDGDESEPVAAEQDNTGTEIQSDAHTASDPESESGSDPDMSTDAKEVHSEDIRPAETTDGMGEEQEDSTSGSATAEVPDQDTDQSHTGTDTTTDTDTDTTTDTPPREDAPTDPPHDDETGSESGDGDTGESGDEDSSDTDGDTDGDGDDDSSGDDDWIF